jgi:hypothetical protein
MPKVVLPTKESGELIILTFDFSSYLQGGEVLTTTTVVSNLYSGVDSDPGAVTRGYTPTITGNVVTCGCGGGVSGAIYQISCTAYSGSTGIHDLSGYLAVVPTLI